MIDKDKQIMLSPADPSFRKIADFDDPYCIATRNYCKARFGRYA